MLINPHNVRFAVPADEDALYDLLMALEEDNNSFGFDISEERIREQIKIGTEARGGAHGVIAGNGCIAASVGLVPDRWWFAEKWSLAQLWLFVRKEYRQSTYADDLQKWAKWFRSDLEKRYGHPVPLINCVISRKRLPVKLRFWRRHSGEMIGGIFEVR
jgi:hypothetical protein